MLTFEDILFRDEWLTVINKPAGLLVHPSRIDKDETESAMMQLRELLGKWVYPVHRLDKPTSGVLVFAMTKETAKQLTEDFTNKSISKKYLAVVRGFALQEDTIDYPLAELWDKMTDKKADRNKPPQQAVTKYKSIAFVELPVAIPPHQSARYSLLEIEPLTGRSRQIRRHMKHIFHPIIGDHQHGHNVHNHFFEERFGNDRLLLHASKIQFAHPVSGESMTITAPLDKRFSEIAGSLFPDAADYFAEAGLIPAK